MDTSIGERLELILRHYNLTKKQFAESISYSPGNITDWIKGRYKPSSKALVNIENIYKVSQNWLINGTGTMFITDISNINSEKPVNTEISKNISSLGPLTEDEINIIKLYRKLTDKDKIKIEGIMEFKATETESTVTHAESYTCQNGGENKNVG